MGLHTPPSEIVLEIAREQYNTLYVGYFLKKKLVLSNAPILHPIQIDSIFYSSSRPYCSRPSCSFLPREDKRIFQTLIDRGIRSFIGRGIYHKAVENFNDAPAMPPLSRKFDLTRVTNSKSYNLLCQRIKEP